MNQLEELLDVAISEPSTSQTMSDWDSVLDTVGARQRRREVAFRIGAVALIAVLGFALFSASFSPGVDTVPAPEAADPTVPEADDGQLWPSNQDLFDAAGERSQLRFWLAWLVGAGIPLLAGVFAWLRVPNHLQLQTRRQRWARLVVAQARAFRIAVAVGVGAVGVLVFSYDPLMVQTGQSWAFSVLQLATLTSVIAAVGWAFALVMANSRENAAVTQRGSSLVTATFTAFVVLFGANIGRGVARTYFDWQQTAGVGGPVRGLWRLLLQGDATFRGPSGDISPIGVALTTLILTTAVGVLIKVVRNSELGALASQPMQPWKSPSERSSGWNILSMIVTVVALALPIFVVIQKDVQAQSIAYMAAIPGEVPLDEWAQTTRSISRNPFDQLQLVTIEFWQGATEFPEMSDNQLLRAEFGFDHRDEERVLRNRGGSVATEVWSVERDSTAGSITVSVRRQLGFGLNTALYVSSVLLLLATATGFRHRSDSDDLSGAKLRESPSQPGGQRAAGWFTVSAATVIGVRLVTSLLTLEAEVGDRASRSGASLYDVYTSGVPAGERALPNPKSLDALSGWFFPFNIAVLIPVFGLAALGLRRLGIARRWLYLVAAMSVAATIVVAVLWGGLINDWFEWFID